jgi:hypothetical protein
VFSFDAPKGNEGEEGENKAGAKSFASNLAFRQPAWTAFESLTMETLRCVVQRFDLVVRKEGVLLGLRALVHHDVRQIMSSFVGG